MLDVLTPDRGPVSERRARPRSLSIGIIASARHPIREPFAGGLESQTHTLALALRKRGHHVRVFASAESDPRLGFEAVCPAGAGLRLSAAARSDESMPAEPFLAEHHAYLSLMLKLAGEKFDVLHNNSLHYLPVAMAETIRCPMLTTLHTPPTPWLESAARARRHPENLHYVAVSHITAEHWAGVVPAGVIHNGVDTAHWRPMHGPRRRRVVWTGRLVPEKGAHFAIRAARLAGFPCTIAGPIGDAAYFRDCVEPELDDEMLYAGHLDRVGLRELVASSAVAAVTPCWEEPFGLVLAEALSCGTPVAAWSRGAVPELLPDRCGRMADPDDVDGLAGAITKAVASADPAACRRFAVQKLSLERMVDQYEELFSRLV